MAAIALLCLHSQFAGAHTVRDGLKNNLKNVILVPAGNEIVRMREQMVDLPVPYGSVQNRLDLRLDRYRRDPTSKSVSKR